MLRKIFLLSISLFVLCFVSYAQPQGGSIKGKVFDELKEGFPFVNVALFQNGNIRVGQQLISMVFLRLVIYLLVRILLKLNL